jgi:hypothetical protein
MYAFSTYGLHKHWSPHKGTLLVNAISFVNTTEVYFTLTITWACEEVTYEAFTFLSSRHNSSHVGLLFLSCHVTLPSVNITLRLTLIDS